MEDQIFQRIFSFEGTPTCKWRAASFQLKFLLLSSFFYHCSFCLWLQLANCLPNHGIGISPSTDRKIVIAGSLLCWGWVTIQEKWFFFFPLQNFFRPKLTFLTGGCLAASSCHVPAKPLKNADTGPSSGPSMLSVKQMKTNFLIMCAFWQQLCWLIKLVFNYS